MESREELEAKLYRLRRQQDDMENHIWRMRKEQKNEADTFQQEYYKCGALIKECESIYPEIAELMEEEQRVIYDFQMRQYEFEEQFCRDSKQEQEQLEADILEVRKQLQNLEQEEGEGRQ